MLLFILYASSNDAKDKMYFFKDFRILMTGMKDDVTYFVYTGPVSILFEEYRLFFFLRIICFGPCNIKYNVTFVDGSERYWLNLCQPIRMQPLPHVHWNGFP